MLVAGSSAPRSSRRSTPASSSSGCKAPTGTRIEQTEAITQEALRVHREGSRAGERRHHLGYVGVVPPSYPINSVYLWMGGPKKAVMRVSLKPASVRIEELKAPAAREAAGAPAGVDGRRNGIARACPPTASDSALADLRLSFEPADIVNEVMSFGSPTPIEVVGQRPEDGRQPRLRREACNELAKIAIAARLQYGQSLDYPTVEVTVDRERMAARRGDGGGRRAVGDAVHLVEPVHRAELLARPGVRHRLPGPGRSAATR